MALSDDLSRRVGSRTKKGTKITNQLVDKVRADESAILEIRENNAKVIAAAIDKAVLKALEAVGIDIEGIASDNAPVDTGRLAASITHAIDGGEPAVYIGTNVEYATAVHEGTSYPKRTPNRFLYNAANDNRSRIQSIFTHALKGA